MWIPQLAESANVLLELGRTDDRGEATNLEVLGAISLRTARQCESGSGVDTAVSSSPAPRSSSTAPSHTMSGKPQPIPAPPISSPAANCLGVVVA